MTPTPATATHHTTRSHATTATLRLSITALLALAIPILAHIATRPTPMPTWLTATLWTYGITMTILYLHLARQTHNLTHILSQPILTAQNKILRLQKQHNRIRLITIITGLPVACALIHHLTHTATSALAAAATPVAITSAIIALKHQHTLNHHINNLNQDQ